MRRVHPELPSLIGQLRRGLVLYVTLSVLGIGLLTAGLHGAWSVYQQHASQQRLADAIAHTLQEPVRQQDWISIKRILEAFALSNSQAVICVRLPDNIVLEQPDCKTPNFRAYPIPLTNLSFQVSVKLPLFDPMALAGLPFLLTSLGLLLFISNYLRKVARQTTADLISLFKQGEDHEMHFEELKNAKVKILEGFRLHSEREKTRADAALGAITAHIAHDIRSPLAALAAIEPDLYSLPEDTRVMVRSAVARIQDIANHLLNLRRLDGAAPVQLQDTALKPVFLPSILEEIVTEKRIQYRSLLDVQIEYVNSTSAYGLFVQASSAALKRTLSNLIDNSVDAVEKKGRISIELSNKSNCAVLTVADNGKGIPRQIISRLGNLGETHGKSGGSGLGLFHAKQFCEGLGGRLDIESTEGNGANISVVLPISAAPSWFLTSLPIKSGSSIVVLDDDVNIHRLWQGRFGSEAGLFHLSTPIDLQNWVSKHSEIKANTIFLVDFELAGFPESGLDLIESLNLGASAILVTSHYADEAVRARCESLGAKIVPKSVAGFLPISFPDKASAKAPLIVLLDDDPMIRLTWEKAAARRAVHLLTFSSAKDLVDRATEIPLGSEIYIDFNLKDSRDGLQVSHELRSLGYDNLYLTTGYAQSAIQAPTWIKGTKGKLPPWL